MSSLQDSILRYIDEQLDAIESAPSTWGPPLCMEVQVLQLLEFRAITLSPQWERRNSQAVLDAYEEFLARKFPGTQPSPLALLLEAEHRTAELAGILGEFRRQLVHRMEATQSEDIFADHDVVLKLWMKRGVTIPPARALSSYYGAFHSALRALAIPYSIEARASRDLAELFERPGVGDAVDFVMSEVRVIPAHGAPAQLILPLNQQDQGNPANQIDQRASTEQIRAALEDIVILNEWAAIAGSKIAELRDDLRGKGSPQRIAAQVLRLIPGKEAAAQTVELGGRLVKRSQPIQIIPSYAARMLEVIQEDRSARRDFDCVGTVRAVDMDQHSIRIKVEGRSFKCWIEDPERIKAACDSLGERVRVIGYEYREPGSAVIIVREIRR